MTERDPLRLLESVTARTEIMKSARAAELVALAASWLGSVPPPLQAAFWGGIPFLTLPVSLFNPGKADERSAGKDRILPTRIARHGRKTYAT